MLVALVAVHLQAVLVPLWVAMHCRGWWLKSGFVCFSLASLAEMVDHTTTDWVYVNHNSFFNGVFYRALTTGLALLTAAVSRSRSWQLTLLLITTAALLLIAHRQISCHRFAVTAFGTDAVPVVATLCGSTFVALRGLGGIDHNDRILLVGSGVPFSICSSDPAAL